MHGCVDVGLFSKVGRSGLLGVNRNAKVAILWLSGILDLYNCARYFAALSNSGDRFAMANDMYEKYKEGFLGI